MNEIRKYVADNRPSFNDCLGQAHATPCQAADSRAGKDEREGGEDGEGAGAGGAGGKSLQVPVEGDQRAVQRPAWSNIWFPGFERKQATQHLSRQVFFFTRP